MKKTPPKNQTKKKKLPCQNIFHMKQNTTAQYVHLGILDRLFGLGGPVLGHRARKRSGGLALVDRDPRLRKGGEGCAKAARGL